MLQVRGRVLAPNPWNILMTLKLDITTGCVNSIGIGLSLNAFTKVTFDGVSSV